MEILISSHVYRANTPYVYAFNDDVSIPNGGKKLSNWAQDYFSKHIFNKDYYFGTLCTHSYKTFLASEFKKGDTWKTKKTYEVDGRENLVCQTFMIILNCLFRHKSSQASMSG